MSDVLKNALALLIAGYDKMRASARTRAATLKFFAAVVEIFSLSWTELVFKQTKRRGRLRDWAKRVGIPLLKAERSPKKWGPVVWDLLLSAAVLFSVDKKGIFWTLLKNLGPLLPCPTCREHYPDLLNEKKWTGTVTTTQDCVAFVKWMREQVRKRTSSATGSTKK
jgi:hypothetical protein